VKSFLNEFWSFLHQKNQKYLNIICLAQRNFPLDCIYVLMIYRQLLLSNVKFAKYFNKNKIGKINIVLKSPENQSNAQKLLLDKQIRFKEFCVSWKIFHEILPRDSFKIFFEKMWFYVKYLVKNRSWRNTYVHGLYIVAVSFNGGGNWRTGRKPPTCRKSLINFIT
jgi:hypothetical protein